MIEIGGNCRFAWFKVCPALYRRDKARALDLCLSFGPSERVPLSFAFASFRIANIEDDCKVAGRPFPYMARRISSLVLR